MVTGEIAQTTFPLANDKHPLHKQRNYAPSYTYRGNGTHHFCRHSAVLNQMTGLRSAWTPSRLRASPYYQWKTADSQLHTLQHKELCLLLLKYTLYAFNRFSVTTMVVETLLSSLSRGNHFLLCNSREWRLHSKKGLIIGVDRASVQVTGWFGSVLTQHPLAFTCKSAIACCQV